MASIVIQHEFSLKKNNDINCGKTIFKTLKHGTQISEKFKIEKTINWFGA